MWCSESVTRGLTKGCAKGLLDAVLGLTHVLTQPTCFLILTAHLTLSLASLAASVIILSIAFHKG